MSSFGKQLERALNLRTDSSGKKVPPANPHANIVRCRETRTYVNITHLGEREQREDQAKREHRLQLAIAGLTDEEFKILTLQGKLVEYEEVPHEVASSDLHLWLNERYTLVPSSQHMVERPGGLPPIECVIVIGLEPVEAEDPSREPLTLQQIASTMGLSIDTVRKRIESAHRKLRAKREEPEDQEGG